MLHYIVSGRGEAGFHVEADEGDVIVFDCDEVIYPFVGGYIPWWVERRRRQGINQRDVYWNEIREFYFPNTPLGGSLKEHKDAVREYHHLPEANKIAPYPAAVALIKALAPVYKLHLVTSRPFDTQDLTEKYFEDFGIAQYFRDMHFLASWHGGKETKRERCEKLNAKAAIEDSWEHCIDVAGGRIPVFAPRKSWNEDLLATLAPHESNHHYANRIKKVCDYEMDIGDVLLPP